MLEHREIFIPPAPPPRHSGAVFHRRYLLVLSALGASLIAWVAAHVENLDKQPPAAAPSHERGDRIATTLKSPEQREGAVRCPPMKPDWNK